MLRLSTILCLNLLVNMMQVNAQGSTYFPKVGDKLDHVFTDFSARNKQSVSIQDRKGKWLVLDFWGRYCSGCVATMPKMDKLNTIFADSVELFMVALCNPKASTNRAATNALFSKLRNKYKFNIVTAFDTLAEKKFDITGVPAIYIINPKGELIAKAQKIDSTILIGLMAGKSPAYERHYSGHEPQLQTYNHSLPLLTSGLKVNGGVDTSATFRSVLTKWNSDMPSWQLYGFDQTPPLSPGWAEAIGFSLKELYFIAYNGVASWEKRGQSGGDLLYRTFSRKIILEIADKTPFEGISGTTPIRSDITYAYSLKFPVKRSNFLNNRKMLLDDLNRYFGYTSVVEERTVKVLKLVVTNQKKYANLKTKGAKHAIKQLRGLSSDRYFLKSDSSIIIKGEYDIGNSYFNIAFKKFFEYASFQEGLNMKYNMITPGRSASENLPLIDDTGLNYKIDISFKEDFKDWEATIERLHDYGLDIVESEIPMKCVVIRDAN